MMLSDDLRTEVFVFGDIDLVAVVEKLLFSFALSQLQEQVTVLFLFDCREY